MRFTIVSLAATLLLTRSDHVFAGKEQQESSLFKDDQSYWNRLLQTGVDSSITAAPTPATAAPTPATAAPTPATAAPTPATAAPTPATAAPTPETLAPTPATAAPTPATAAPTPATAAPTPATAAPTPETPPPTTRQPTPPMPVGEPSDLCFVQVDAECVPPVDPADPDGARFEDCDSINIAPAECTEFVTLLTFRFNGGDCLDSNNIQDPRIYSCEDFFDGPPSSDDFGAEAYMTISDIKGQGIFYYDGIVAVGDVFNITNILPNPVIIANVNVTIYEGTAVASENIRETIIIHTSCSQVTFLKDRYGVLELIGFANPSQGYQACIVPVFFTFGLLNTAEGFKAVLETLQSVTNFDPPNEILNFTEDVVGITLEPGEVLNLTSPEVQIDLSVRRRYTAVTTIQGVSPEGFSCRADDITIFTAGVIDTRPTPSPAGP